MVYPPEDDDGLLEYEAAIDQYVFENWFNLEFFHDFIFEEADDYEPANPNMRAYLNHSNLHDRLHTNDCITPPTFVYLISHATMESEWQCYLRQRWLNEG